MACLTASIRMRLFAMAGVMVKVGAKLMRFFVVIRASLTTKSNAVMLRLYCVYYTDKMLLNLDSEN
jgi:hypothetical protein